MRGFSLIEVLLATGLLATGVLGLAHLMTVAIGVNVASRHTTVATVLAAQKVEEIQAGGDAASSEDVVDGFRRRWIVHPVPATAGGLIVVHVIVDSPVSIAGRGLPVRITAVVATAP